MRILTKSLILLAFAAALSGCVVAPGYYGRPRAYLAVPAPAVVVRPAYYGGYYYYGPRYYYGPP